MTAPTPDTPATTWPTDEERWVAMQGVNLANASRWAPMAMVNHAIEALADVVAAREAAAYARARDDHDAEVERLRVHLAGYIGEEGDDGLTLCVDAEADRDEPTAEVARLRAEVAAAEQQRDLYRRAMEKATAASVEQIAHTEALAAAAERRGAERVLSELLDDLWEHADGNVGDGCWDLHDKWADRWRARAAAVADTDTTIEGDPS